MFKVFIVTKTHSKTSSTTYHEYYLDKVDLENTEKTVWTLFHFRRALVCAHGTMRMLVTISYARNRDTCLLVVLASI